MFCAVPQVILCYKQGHAEGQSQALLFMWLGGEIFMTTYLTLKNGFDMPVILNAGANLIWIASIMKYKYWPVERSK